MTSLTPAAEELPTPKKIRLFPTRDVRKRYARRLEDLKDAAREAIGNAGMGIELHYLKFAHAGDTFALSARIDRKNKSLDIEVDYVSPNMTNRVITTAEYRAAEARRADERRSARAH